jgi:hypothetical protein
VDLAGSSGSNRIHTCIIFGGYGGLDAGEENIPYSSSGAAVFAEKARALGMNVKDWAGSLQDNEVINPAIAFVRETFNPKGKLVVYGYSAGGINALRFTKELERRLHSFSKGVFLTENGPLGPSDDVIVDLLITIDAYSPSASSADHRVGRNVRQFINIFQRHSQRVTGSRGARLSREVADGEQDCNQDRTGWAEYKESGRGLPGGGAHSRIDEDTHRPVFEKVEALITWGPSAVSCRLLW